MRLAIAALILGACSQPAPPHCDGDRPVCPDPHSEPACDTRLISDDMGLRLVGSGARGTCQLRTVDEYAWRCEQGDGTVTDGEPTCVPNLGGAFDWPHCPDCEARCIEYRPGAFTWTCYRGGVRVHDFGGFSCLSEDAPRDTDSSIAPNCAGLGPATCVRSGGAPTPYDLVEPDCLGVAEPI